MKKVKGEGSSPFLKNSCMNRPEGEKSHENHKNHER